MERLETIKGILKSQNGCEMIFSVPMKGTDNCLSWTLCEKEGVRACYVDAVCKEGFDGKSAVILRPEIFNKQVDYVAIQKHSEYWCRPLFGNDLSALPTVKKPIQGLLIREGELWRYYLPVCDDTYKTVIFGYEEGFEFHVYANCNGLIACENQLAFVYGEGTDPFEVLRRCAKAAAVLLDNGLRMREERRVPEVFEYLGWCSWDAMQIHISHEGLLVKAKEFRDKNVPIQFAILDDMWADCPHLKEIPADADRSSMGKEMHKSKMRSFDGDPDRFPKGMKAAIADLKAAGIPKVGIWFPTTGYWNGFEPDGEAAEWMDYLIVSAGDGLSGSTSGKLVVIPEADKAFALFDLFCARIRSWGGDFVKIDNQGFLAKNYENIRPIGQAARAMQTALDSATGSNFDGALINCMGMPSECMFNRRNSAISRCSDDFLPESREWFAKNILQCSYNGLLQGQYYVNDWDMWWTDDEQAKKNSLCRAISGGPIYISDKIGRTNPEILLPLALKSGRILRPDESATPTADCLIGDPTEAGRIFKIRNRVGKNGLAAVFNIDAENRAVSGTLRPAETGVPDGDYAYYEYFSGETGILREGETLEISLNDNDTFRLYTFVPYVDGKPAVLGRLDKFIGVKVVTDQTDRGITLMEGGVLGFVSETPLALEANGEQLTVERQGLLNVVRVGEESTHLYYL